jgi:hypothetical protein
MWEQERCGGALRWVLGRRAGYICLMKSVQAYAPLPREHCCRVFRASPCTCQCPFLHEAMPVVAAVARRARQYVSKKASKLGLLARAATRRMT